MRLIGVMDLLVFAAGSALVVFSFDLEPLQYAAIIVLAWSVKPTLFDD